ncbi:unnamed protein product [Penicillium salamii]|nr:unnamed protein product [Penicillium salamii]
MPSKVDIAQVPAMRCQLCDHLYCPSSPHSPSHHYIRPGDVIHQHYKYPNSHSFSLLLFTALGSYLHSYEISICHRYQVICNPSSPLLLQIPKLLRLLRQVCFILRVPVSCPHLKHFPRIETPTSNFLISIIFVISKIVVVLSLSLSPLATCLPSFCCLLCVGLRNNTSAVSLRSLSPTLNKSGEHTSLVQRTFRSLLLSIGISSIEISVTSYCTPHPQPFFLLSSTTYSQQFSTMSGRGSRDLPIRGPRGGGDRGRGRGSDRGRSAAADNDSRMFKDPIPNPDGRMLNHEDQCVTSFLEDKKDAKCRLSDAKGVVLAYRPGYGTLGRPLNYRANMFVMDFQPDMMVHSYRLKFSPTDITRGQQTFVIKHMLRLYAPFVQKGARIATDGATEVVTLEPLPEDRGVHRVSMPKGNDNDNTGQRPQHSQRPQRSQQGQGARWTVTVEHKESHLINDVLGGLRDPRFRKVVPNKDTSDAEGSHGTHAETNVVRMLNILMSAYPNRTPGTYIVGRGRNKVFRLDHEKQSQYLGGGFEAVRGYYSSVRLAAGHIMLNLNISHSAMFRPGSLINMMDEFRAVNGESRELLNSWLSRLKVYALHLPKRENGDGKMEFPIKHILGTANPGDGLEDKHPPRVKNVASCADNVQFWYEDGDNEGYITVTEYFRQRYNRQLKYGATHPIVNVGSRKSASYLPAELCEILPGQIFGGTQTGSMSSNMIRFSCRRPPQNYDSIMKEGMGIMGIDDDTKTVGIKPRKDMAMVPARILNAPNLVYAKKVNKPQRGQWNLQDTKFCEGANIKTWTCLTVRRQGKHTSNVESEMNVMHSKLRAHGINIGRPGLPFISVDIGQDHAKNREALETTLINLQKNERYDLLIVILPDTDAAIFDWIKLLGDLRLGILTHCMILDKLKKQQGQDQYISNNAMKINLKMGGCNQFLEPSGLKFIAQGKTMVIGLDVTHPASGEIWMPSIAGIVASIDGHMGQWPGEVRPQESRSEEIVCLDSLLLARLDLWIKHNKAPPSNILIYRDGVSEGQFMMVLKDELPRVRQAAADLSRYRPEYHKFQGYSPKVTIIISGKHHHVRFYPTKATDADKTNNPINGAIVDRIVTRPLYWEFYLQAQSPLQGSARPAHYIVIHDEIFTDPKISPGKPADVVQEPTHNICYMMGRATRSVSYATPAFLADRYCDRARKYVAAKNAVDRYNAELEKSGKSKPKPKEQMTKDQKDKSNESMVMAVHSHFPNSMVYI